MQFARALRPVTVATSALLFASGLFGCGAPQKALTGGNGHAAVTFYALPDSTGATQAIVDKCNAVSDSRFTIELKAVNPGDPRTQITRKLSARDSTVDLIEIDVDWNPEFTAAGWAQQLTGRTKSHITKTTLNGPTQTAVNNERLYAAPFTANTQVLWYRSDLIPNVPKTWADVMTEITKLRDAKKPYRLEAIGPQSISSTNFLNGLTWSAGGSLIDEDGKQVDTQSSNSMVAAVDLIHRLIVQEATSPVGLANLTVGASAFALAPPDAYEGNPPAGVTWAPFPSMSPEHIRGPQLSGTSLVVSAYSSHQRQAIAALECLRSDENQRTLATVGKKIPVLQALQEDPEVQAVMPRLSELTPMIENGAPPIQTPVANSVENAVNKAMLPLLNPSTAQGADALAIKRQLEIAINDALKFRSIQG